MSNIKQFNPKILDTMRERMNEQLAAIGEEYGVTFDIGRIGYSSHEFNVKVNCKVGSQEEAERRDWNQWAPILERLHGLTEDDYGAEFESKGERYALIGFAPNRPKFPFDVRRVKDDKRFKFTEQAAHIVRHQREIEARREGQA